MNNRNDLSENYSIYNFIEFILKVLILFIFIFLVIIIFTNSERILELERLHSDDYCTECGKLK